MSSSTPERDPAMEAVPDADYGLDPEESTGDPLEPVPMDGRDGQPAEGSSDSAATMAEDDPLRDPVYVEEEDPAYIDGEVDLLEDERALEDPEADELANESIDEERTGELDRRLTEDAGDDFGSLADPEADDPGTDEDLAEELGDDPDSASN